MRSRWRSLIRVLSGLLQQQAHGRRQALPTVEFALQLLPALARQPVELRAASMRCLFPFRRDPALLLEPMQRWIERALLHRQHVVRELQHSLGDAPAMQRLTRERLQNEEVERALEKVGGFRHESACVTLDE